MEKTFKKSFKFKDANDKMAFIDLEVTNRNKYLELTICGEIDGGHGQCYDRIKPNTAFQRELIKLWKTKHLKKVTDTEIKKIQQLVDDIIEDENERIGDLTFEEYVKENDDEDALTYIRENASFGDDHKVLALCLEEGLTLSELDSITEEGSNRYSYGGREWLVCTNEEADEEQDQEIENYIDECILPELNERYRNYFDNEAFKVDARMDGRGHSLARYDGHEQEQNVNGTTYYLYRQ